MPANIPAFTPAELKGFRVIDRQFCQGGYGLIKMVQDQETKELFILKKCLMRYQEYSKYQGLFHPRIVSPISYVISHPYQIILFEKWDMDLHDYCVNFPQQFDKRIDHIFKGVIDALLYLHDEGVYHNDIKMANIFLKSKDLFVGLGDFSLSGRGGQKRDYARDIFQLLYMMWRAYRGPKLVESYYSSSDQQMIDAISVYKPQKRLYGGLIHYVLSLHFSDYPTIGTLKEWVIEAERVHNLLKAQTKRIIAKQKRVCAKCGKKQSSSNYSRHLKRCKQ